MTEQDLANDASTSKKPLTSQAERALAEAEERRRAHKSEPDGQNATKEIGGRDGPDPIRYGDWEKGGLASDF